MNRSPLPLVPLRFASPRAVLTAVVAPALALGAFVGASPAQAAPEQRVETKALAELPFESAPTPTMKGETIVGKELAVEYAGWVPNPQTFTYEWLRGNSVIPGTNNSRLYVLTAADEGKQVSVRVTATREGYQTTARTSAARLVQPAPPLEEFSVAPTPKVLGDGNVGSSLLGQEGEWAPAPDYFGTEWLLEGAPIPNGAAIHSLPIRAEWEGKRVSWRVTAYRDGYRSTVRTSEPVTIRPPRKHFPSSPAPTVEVLDGGEARVGGTILAAVGAWAPEPEKMSYSWRRDGVPIPGAFAASYVPVEADLGKQLTVLVSGSKKDYWPASAESGARTVYAADSALGDFTTTPTPTISGTAKVGYTLTAKPGVWVPDLASSTFQWEREGVQIPGATAAEYTPVAADAGKKIAVWVTGSKPGYRARVRISSSVTVAEADPDKVFTSTPEPSIRGEVRVGTPLEAVTGDWEPTPDELKLQWLRDGQPIPGATTAKLIPEPIDEGKQLSVRVTATKSEYHTVVRTSAAQTVAAEIPAPEFTSAPTPLLAGDVRVGAAVTANPGEWAPTPEVLSYQWLRDGVPISGARDAVYTPKQGDASAYLSVRVSALKAGYATSTRVSIERFVQPADSGLQAFASAPTPTLSVAGGGQLLVGSVVTVAPGEWSPQPEAFTYQWERNGMVIPGAVSSVYVPVEADKNQQLAVRVAGARSGYQTAIRVSATVSVQAAAAGTSEFSAAPDPALVTAGGGAVRVGAETTVQPGPWVPSPGEFSYRWERDGVAIPGATSESYTPEASDAGKRLTAWVTASKAGYRTAIRSVTSSPVAPAIDPALEEFTSVPTPIVLGDAQVGATLMAAPGEWTPAPDGLAYQWLRGGVPIPGASDVAYTATEADRATELSVRVTATKVGYRKTGKDSIGHEVKPADPALKVFTSAPTPTLSAVPKVGSAITAVPGSWDPRPDGFEYQWERNGVPIAGATARSYTPVGAEAGTQLRVRVTASKPGYHQTVRVSDAQTVLAADTVLLLFTSAPTPTISGTPRVGATVTVSPGEWAPAPESFVYQWYRDAAPIAGAVAAAYTPVAEDEGTQLSVRVTASKTGYAATAKESEAKTVLDVGSVLSPFTDAPTPTISVGGDAVQVGAKATALPGDWEPTPGSFTYQWERSGIEIAGATSADYTPVAADEGFYLAVRVTAVKSGYHTTTRVSAARKVAGEAAPLLEFSETPAPTIQVGGDGTARVGVKLTASAGAWAPEPEALKLQWLRDGSAIPDATNAEYTPVVADEGKRLSLRVTATRFGYRTTAKTSTELPATAPAQLLEFTTTPVPVVAVTGGGTATVGVRLSATAGAWAPVPDALAFQWLRNGTAITGATSAAYTPVAADAGAKLQVRVTATRAGYRTTQQTSVAQPVTAAKPVVKKLTATPKPKISGTAKVGKKLTVKPGAWKPGKVTLKVQWLRNGKAIKGATKTKYKITTKDRGKRISVRVTGSQRGYASVAKVSSAKRVAKRK